MSINPEAKLREEAQILYFDTKLISTKTNDTNSPEKMWTVGQCCCGRCMLSSLDESTDTDSVQRLHGADSHVKSLVTLFSYKLCCCC